MSHIFHLLCVFQIFSTKIQISSSFPQQFDNFTDFLHDFSKFFFIFQVFGHPEVFKWYNMFVYLWSFNIFRHEQYAPERSKILSFSKTGTNSDSQINSPQNDTKYD